MREWETKIRPFQTAIKNKRHLCRIVWLSNGISLFTLFKNHQKYPIWMFEFWHFPPFFVLWKVTCLVTLFDRKLLVVINRPNWPFFGIFNEFLSTQNLNVARFARKVVCDFFFNFQTPWFYVIEQIFTLKWNRYYGVFGVLFKSEQV